MKLLIVSHTPHYLHGDTVVGFGPTVREIDHLTRLFTSVVHLAPLHRDETAPASSLPYRSSAVSLHPLPVTGGEGGLAKLGILLRAPAFLSTLRRELKGVEAWHVRAPANVALLSMAAFALLPARPCWVKYAGNWHPDGPEALSYTWQRRWLTRPRELVAVTVNGRWPGDPPHLVAFRNPSFEEDEIAAAGKGPRQLPGPGERLELLFVGRLEEKKGAGRALEILAGLRARGVVARLVLVGAGTERPQLESRAAELGVGESTFFAGELPRPELAPLYRRAHFLLLPSRSSEGWPKVLSEAMAYGALPLAGAVSSIPQILGEASVGRALPPGDIAGFLAALGEYLEGPELFAAESARAREVAADFTYDRHLAAIQELFFKRWKIQLAPCLPMPR